MSLHLVVVRPFGAHAKGDVIADETAITSVLNSENSVCVVRVIAPAPQQKG